MKEKLPKISKIPAISYLLMILIVFGTAPSSSFPEEFINIGEFSAFQSQSDLLEKWHPLTFDKIEKHTRYFLVHTDRGSAVRAESANAASGLIRKMPVDIHKYPIIEWSWKITRTFKKGDVTKKSGDDYPARIYIAFQYDPAKVTFLERIKFNAVKALHGEYPPTAAINYIWASKASEGTIVPNPYTDRVKMIVVRSGEDLANRWIDEKRNIYHDYKKAFNDADPPMVSGIAIMTDTDNTADSAVSYYGDIRLRQK